MGKTTSKKALSCGRTQGVQNPGSDGARQAWTYVRARDLRTRMSDRNWVQKPVEFFHFIFEFFQQEIKSLDKTGTEFNMD